MSTKPEPPQAAVVVAHPDDETLWAGGMILSHPENAWFITCLSRKSDADRSAKFRQVLQGLKASGEMGDLEDGPEQKPLEIRSIQAEILRLLPDRRYELVLTHGPGGEYTRHRRHEEVSRAVSDLWIRGRLPARWLGFFAYEDQHGERLPTAIPSAHQVQRLPPDLYAEKRRLVTEVYGFEPDSWEARTTPHVEAFWFFESPRQLTAWLEVKEDD